MVGLIGVGSAIVILKWLFRDVLIKWVLKDVFNSLELFGYDDLKEIENNVKEG